MATTGGPIFTPTNPGTNRYGEKVQEGLYARGSGYVAAHSAGAFAVIIALIIVVIVLYASNAGWFGGKRSRFPSWLPWRRAPRSEAMEEEDPETSRLINSLNGEN
jgi:hypothetical protein